MANLSEQSIWEAGVYQIEENDPVHGGANGITNRPTKQLANRTVWLKNELASSVQAINANLTNLSNNKADKTLNLVAGNGLTGGGTLQASRTVALGTPSQITASSTNSVTATSHTHAIDKASTTVAGVVQLVDNLTTDDATKALTAKQGKVLNDRITATDAKADNKVDKSGDTMTGVLGIARNAWEKMRFTNADGSFWRFESAPIASGENGARFNWVFTGGAGTEVGRIIFPRVTGSETIAYQSWVQTANVASATRLATARTINGVAFDGTTNITIADNTKAPAVHRHNWSEIDSIPAVITNPARITEGNLDSYMAEGVYYCNDNIQAAAITNTPVNRAFALQVLKTAGVVQVCYEYQTTNVFVRARSGGGDWSPWRRLSTTEDNAPTATQLQTTRTISITGDATWSVSFDGSANASGALTLANSGVTAGSYNAVTVDAKGRVTRGLSQVHGLITATTATGTANQATTNGNTYLNIVTSGVGSTASVGSSTQVTGTNGITVSSDTAGKLIISRDSNSPTATQLQTARTINGVAFDGTANITIADNTKAPAVHRHNWGEIDGKPSTFAPSSHTHSIANITDFDIRELGTDNLDDITKWGVYAQMANTNATAARNYPVAQEAGTLEVMISTYGLRQRFTTFNSHRHFERRRNNPMTAWENWIEVSNTWDAIRNKPSNLAYTSSNVASASRLATARTISLTGAVTGSVSFDGSGNVSIGTTLPSIASNVVVMTGTIDHGGTIPLPNGFTESQCKWMVSMHEDNTGNATWDLWESARLRHYGFRCFCDGRIVTAQAYLTGHNSPPGWVNGRANYIIIGVK